MTPEEEDDLQHVHRLIFQDLGFCACGDPESVYDLIRDLLAIFKERTDYVHSINPVDFAVAMKGPCTRTLMKERIDSSEAAYYAILYWLDGADLLDHGTSIASSWLTRKGYHYLSLMQKYGFRDMENDKGNGFIVGEPHYNPEIPWDDPSQGVCGPGCRHWEASTPEYEKKDIIAQMKKEGKL